MPRCTSRWFLCKRSTAGRLFSLELSRGNVLCIYVEYCVTSRAGKCLETCNTDKPRFDDFTGRPVRVRAAGFTGSISSLCPSEIPSRGPIPRSKFSEERNPNNRRIFTTKGTTFIADSPFHLDHLLLDTSSLDITLLQGRSTSFQMEIGMYTFCIRLLHTKYLFLLIKQTHVNSHE